jgi:hypothetical protein
VGGFDDPAGDLAAVGNQDSLEHSGYETRVPVVWLNGVLAAVSMTAASRSAVAGVATESPL